MAKVNLKNWVKEFLRMFLKKSSGTLRGSIITEMKKVEPSLADILTRPKIVIFPSGPTDPFYLHCQEREAGIKHEHQICLRTFDFNLKQFKRHEGTLKKWEQEKIKSSTRNLGAYLEYLTLELDKEKIEAYFKLTKPSGERLIPFLSDMLLLLINSYQGAVESDLHWVTDLTLSDTIDLSIGDFDFNKLEKYIPSRITEIENLCEELHAIDFVSEHEGSIKEAIDCYQSKYLKASNVLLMTVIEGLVRSLGKKLILRQGLNVDPADKRKYASLDGFINKISWKKDLSISGIKYGLLTGNLAFYKDIPPDLVKASLAERLCFLTRRFKEYRNVILHGEEAQYANTLNSFMNLTALKEVLQTIQEYTIIYP